MAFKSPFQPKLFHDSMILLFCGLLPVVWATLTSPCRKIFFSLGFMTKFLAPPVTEMSRLGASRPQCCVMRW